MAAGRDSRNRAACMSAGGIGLGSGNGTISSYARGHTGIRQRGRVQTRTGCIGQRNSIRCSTMATTNSGFFMQNTFAPVGNFDVVVPSAHGGLVHVWRDNNSDGFPWKEPAFFYSGFLDGASLIQGSDRDQPAGEMEVVFRAGDRLAHIVCQCEPAAAGQPGFEHSRWKPAGFLRLRHLRPARFYPEPVRHERELRSRRPPGDRWAGAFFPR